MDVAGTLATDPVTASDILGGVLSSLLSLAMSPGGALLLLLLIVGLGRRLRGVTGHEDPERRFSRAEKAEILRRAGGRCEHHHMLYGRCGEQIRLEADHVHPHSRGGWTHVANGQALCRRHNKAKWASVPTNGELRRLARRRTSYVPPGVPVQVVRRAPKGTHVPPPAPPPVKTLMAPPVAPPTAPPIPRPAPVPTGTPPVNQTVRQFDPPRPVDVLVDGTWRPGLQQAWRREGGHWTAEVSWFAGYAADGGRQVIAVPADCVRLQSLQDPRVS